MKMFKLKRTEQGFTLIEILVVVVIIAILAAIAIPNYRQFVQKNAEEQVRARILSIDSELASLRSKAFTYADFYPNNSCDGSETIDCKCSNDTNIGEYCYRDAVKQQIYIPLESDATNYKYLVTIGDADPVGGETATMKSLTDGTVDGLGWRMIAVPNTSNGVLASANSYVMDSLGNRCMYAKGVSLPTKAEEVDCSKTGVKSW